VIIKDREFLLPGQIDEGRTLMKTFNYVIISDIGIHARPAAMLVGEAKSVKSTVTLSVNGKRANAASILGLIGLGVKQGMEVCVSIEGEDEDAAAVRLEEFFKINL
jgi:phosphocarrier protein